MPAARSDQDLGVAELSKNGRRRVYRVLLKVARADKRLHPAEVRALARMRGVLGLSEEEALELEREPVGAALRLGNSDHERQVLAQLMVELALADRDLALREFRVLRQVALAIGLPQEQLVEAIEAATKAAEGEA